MDDAGAPFQAPLRQARDAAGMKALVRALGLESRLEEVPAAGWPPLGVPADAGVRRVLRLGDRGGLAALLFELSGEATADAVSRLAGGVRARHAARPWLFVFAPPRYRTITLASFGLDGALRRLTVDRQRPRATDLEALAEMAAGEGEGGVALALRHARALDRTRVTRQFFRDFRAHRSRVSAAWTGIPGDLASERDQLALLLLCRLMFLCFLQRGGHLAGDPRYMRHLLAGWQRAPGRGSFYRAMLHPLFFGALNARPEARSMAARALGALPYLNGGLFERHALERRFPALDLADDVVAAVIEALLDRYRFTTREAAEAVADGEADAGVDPEMLGRVFEGLMAEDRRGRTGTFYTPAPVVDRLVREALATYAAGQAELTAVEAERIVRQGDASVLEPPRRRALAADLARIRVLDPACGSGAFLLGALSRLARLRAALEAPGADVVELRRDIVGRTLHGVDVQDDAALLCALRLWLALAARTEPRSAAAAAVPPLPNLDRRIRQGDALVDPLDLVVGTEGPASAWRMIGTDVTVRQRLREIQPLARRYLGAEPEEKPALQRLLAASEAALAAAWLDALDRRLRRRLAEARALADARDLFGERPPEAEAAAEACGEMADRLAHLDSLRAGLADAGALPFFSFGIHFAEATERGFDLVLSNPPWVRSHRWPAPLRELVRRRYAVCRGGGWRGGTALSGAPAGAGAQVDLSLLFLERSLQLLAPGGVLAMLLPAKALRSLYGGGARRMLLRETELMLVEDHSLDQRSIFRADAFAAAVVARRREAAEPPDGALRIEMVRRGVPPLRFALPRAELPVVPADIDSPWLLAPPAVTAAFRRMQAAGPPLGARPDLRVSRGIFTGANDVLLVPQAEFKLGGLARIRAAGHRRSRRAGRPAGAVRRFAAYIESSALRPLVRGGGISAWRYRTDGYILWCHDDRTAEPSPPPRRTATYLERHGPALRARDGWRPGRPTGAVFRVRPDALGAKVAWHDLADTLKAVALPARVSAGDGSRNPLVPLNTVYYIPVPDDDHAMLLAALFNSLPVRTFARAVAERAKDARFRFLAWTVALIPLPDGWDTGPAADRLLRVSRTAHGSGGIDPAAQAELDHVVAGIYRLDADAMDALASFDRWLRGEAAP